MSRGTVRTGSGGSAGMFLTTHWTVVQRAGGQRSAESDAALEELCRDYWHPLYVYVRRRGYTPEDAQDLTQEFFTHLLRKNGLRLADPQRGRFRTFLLHALEHFLINEWKHGQSPRHGGGAIWLSLDVDETEKRCAADLRGPLTPESAYDRRWAITLLDKVLAGLEQEYCERGRGRVFAELAQLLWGQDERSYAELGIELGFSPGAVRASMCRLRKQYRERLRHEVAQTVSDVGEIDGELEHLISVICQGK